MDKNNKEIQSIIKPIEHKIQIAYDEKEIDSALLKTCILDNKFKNEISNSSSTIKNNSKVIKEYLKNNESI